MEQFIGSPALRAYLTHCLADKWDSDVTIAVEAMGLTAQVERPTFEVVQADALNMLKWGLYETALLPCPAGEQVQAEVSLLRFIPLGKTVQETLKNYKESLAATHDSIFAAQVEEKLIGLSRNAQQLRRKQVSTVLDCIELLQTAVNALLDEPPRYASVGECFARVCNRKSLTWEERRRYAVNLMESRHGRSKEE